MSLTPLQPISFVFNGSSLYSGMAPQRDVISQFAADGVTVLDILTVDATLQEQHSAEVDITENPVEVGANLTDHQRPKPVVVTIDGVVTNTPIDSGAFGLVQAAAQALTPVVGFAKSAAAAGAALVGQATGNVTPTRAQEAFSRLNYIRNNGLLLVIKTPLKTYYNMAMQSLNVVRDPRTGDALRFLAVFKEIITAQSKTVFTQPMADSAQSPLDTGSQSLRPASLSLQNTGASLAYKWVHGIGPNPVTALINWATGRN